MHTAVAELTAALINDMKATGADKLLLGNLPPDTPPGTYSGPVDTSDRTPELESARESRAKLVALARSESGVDTPPVTSSLPDGQYPLWCHIPDQNGWFQVDGIPCELFPHVVVALQDMASRGDSVQTLHVTNELGHIATLGD